MKALMISALLAGVSSTAFAADVVTPEPVAPEVVEEIPVSSWDGAYIGAFGGITWLDGKYDFGATDHSRTQTGGAIGKFVGYNYQFDNNFVLGVEGDVSYTYVAAMKLQFTRDIALRASFTEGFYPPDWNDLSDAVPVSPTNVSLAGFTTFLDPFRGNRPLSENGGVTSFGLLN